MLKSYYYCIAYHDFRTSPSEKSFSRFKAVRRTVAPASWDLSPSCLPSSFQGLRNLRVSKGLPGNPDGLPIAGFLRYFPSPKLEILELSGLDFSLSGPVSQDLSGSYGRSSVTELRITDASLPGTDVYELFRFPKQLKKLIYLTIEEPIASPSQLISAFNPPE